MNHFKTQYNAENFEHNREVFTLESKTQPDQTMSIEKMLKRHEDGLPIQGPKNAHMFYDVPEDVGFVPDVRSLDLTEIQDLRDSLSQRVKEIKYNQEQEKLKDKEEPPAPQPPAPDPGEASQPKE